jgi:peptidoglycan/xylan/chitin deacetylase (PgdA/CDA1 family)
MSRAQLLERLYGKYQRTSARLFFKRSFEINTSVPLISFTFDDFPRSALSTGGAILRSVGARGTYYTALGLMGQQRSTGTMFTREDLKLALEQGHELGCHTFHHDHAWDTKPSAFESSVIENQRALGSLFPGAVFDSLSYPKSQPRARTKHRMEKRFACCRGGGQTFNAGTADLNCLTAYFLEQSKGDADAVKRLIDENRKARGWLIFATHDVCAAPTAWGCAPEFFEDIVHYAAKSEASILPVAEAWKAIRASSHPSAE